MRSFVSIDCLNRAEILFWRLERSLSTSLIKSVAIAGKAITKTSIISWSTYDSLAARSLFVLSSMIKQPAILVHFNTRIMTSKMAIVKK